MFVRTCWLWIFCFAICRNLAYGQNATGSPYSYFGVGDISRYKTAYSLGLGGTGIALKSPDNLTDQNPASYTSIKSASTFLFSLGTLGSYVNRKTASESTTQFDYNFTSLSFWLRFKKNWAGSIGIAPYSKIDYNVVSNNSYSNLPNEYGITYQGSGGLYQLFFGNAVEVAKNLSLGIRVSYFFGPMNRTRLLSVGQSGTEIKIEQNTFSHAFNSDYGIQYTLHGKRTAYTLGAIFGHQSKLRGTDKTTIINLNDNETLEESESKLAGYIVPLKAGFGLSVSAREKITFSADVLYEQWSRGDFNAATSDVFRYSAGCEIKIGGDANAKRQFSFPIRLGYFYEQSYIQIRNYRPNATGFSLGFGIPISKISMVNLAYAYSTRGKATSYLVHETYHTISIDIMLKDIWFQRSKYN